MAVKFNINFMKFQMSAKVGKSACREYKKHQLDIFHIRESGTHLCDNYEKLIFISILIFNCYKNSWFA